MSIYKQPIVGDKILFENENFTIESFEPNGSIKCLGSKVIYLRGTHIQFSRLHSEVINDLDTIQDEYLKQRIPVEYGRLSQKFTNTNSQIVLDTIGLPENIRDTLNLYAEKHALDFLGS